jgi:hypothetical protein
MRKNNWPLAGVDVRLYEQGTGRLFTDDFVPVDCVYGTAQLPAKLCAPKILDPNAIFTAEAVNNVTATSATLRLVHNGYRVLGDFNKWRWWNT